VPDFSPVRPRRRLLRRVPDRRDEPLLAALRRPPGRRAEQELELRADRLREPADLPALPVEPARVLRRHAPGRRRQRAGRLRERSRPAPAGTTSPASARRPRSTWSSSQAT